MAGAGTSPGLTWRCIEMRTSVFPAKGMTGRRGSTPQIGAKVTPDISRAPLAPSFSR